MSGEEQAQTEAELPPVITRRLRVMRDVLPSIEAMLDAVLESTNRHKISIEELQMNTNPLETIMEIRDMPRPKLAVLFEAFLIVGQLEIILQNIDYSTQAGVSQMRMQIQDLRRKIEAVIKTDEAFPELAK